MKKGEPANMGAEKTINIEANDGYVPDYNFDYLYILHGVEIFAKYIDINPYSMRK